MTARVEALAARLLGTCKGDVDEIGEFTAAECFEFDSLVFECEGCNWWHAGGEQADDDSGWFCVECRPLAAGD